MRSLESVRSEGRRERGEGRGDVVRRIGWTWQRSRKCSTESSKSSADEIAVPNESFQR
jgi:hypothetical protein